MIAISLFLFSLLLAFNSVEGGNQLGYSLSTYGSFLAVGSQGYEQGQGAVFIYSCAAPANCTQQQILTATDGRSSDTFGESVAVYKELLIVGAPGKTSASGTIYVYNCSTASNCQFLSELPVPKSAPNQTFGFALFASNYWVLASAIGKNNYTGEAFFLNCTDATRCTISSIILPADLQTNDQFGYSVGMNGSLVVVGARNQNGANGAAYAYDCSIPQACVQIAKFVPPPVANSLLPPTNFGQSLWVDNTNIVYIGAPGWLNKTGAIWIYNCSSGKTCSAQGLLLQPQDVQLGDQFGASIAASNGIVVIGAPGRRNQLGGAYVFDCVNAAGNCTQTGFLNSPDGSAGDMFGFSVAVTDTVINVGAPDYNANQGSVYTFGTHEYIPSVAPPSPNPTQNLPPPPVPT